jgi:predicted membrane protein
MRELDVNVGAADFSASRLANANADQIRIHGGIGGVDLDFGGRWTRDLSVVASLAIGKLTLRIPPDVGVRLDLQRVAAGFEHEGLMIKRDDAWYSANWESAPRKLRIRAETFFGQIEMQRAPR